MEIQRLQATVANIGQVTKGKDGLQP